MDMMINPKIYNVFHNVEYIREYVYNTVDDLIGDFGQYKSKQTICNELFRIIYEHECCNELELQSHLNNYISKYVDDSYNMNKQNRQIEKLS